MNFQKILSKDLTNESYHNRPNSLSSSGVKDLAKSVELWKFNKENRKESRSMRIGTAFHDSVLEPDKSFWVVIPEEDRRTVKGWANIIKSLGRTRGLKKYLMKDLKALYEKMEATAKKRGILFIEAKELVVIESMKKGIQQHDDLGLEGANLLSLDNLGCETETSFFVPIKALEGFEDCELELELRIRPDYFIDGEYMADLKSTKTSEPAKFKWEVLKYGYHVSAAFYLDVYNAYMRRQKTYGHVVGKWNDVYSPIDRFFLIACENTGTGICTNFELSQELIEEGRQIYRRGIQNYIDYQKPFTYGGYSQEIIML